MKKIIPLIVIFSLIAVALILMNSTNHLINKQNSLTENTCDEISYADQKKLVEKIYKSFY